MAYTTINKSSDYFNTKLYTGTGSSNAVTGVGFEPSFTWIKNRGGTSFHNLYDVIRGATKTLNSATGAAESTSGSGLTAWGSDGFTVVSDGDVNASSNPYASWNWKANGAGSVNYNGSITSTVSASATSGFSIVKWTGNGSTATIGHGLGVAPSVILVKNYGASMNWISYWKALGANKYLELNLENAAGTGTTEWNNTSPTSSVFSVGNTGSGNQSGGSLIAYCFAEKQGYSKFGSYVGNGNADGTFVYTGFKPGFILWKNSTEAYGWYILDTKRDPDNVAGQYIYANVPDAEATNPFFDINSNGFKCRESGGGSNKSGNKYIYMAFAEAPLVGTNNVPATAR